MGVGAARRIADSLRDKQRHRNCGQKELGIDWVEQNLREISPPVPPVKWVCLGWDGRWFGLRGWMLVHVLVGDGSVGRVHLYSRMGEENPTCATAKRAERLDLRWLHVDDIVRATDWAGRLRQRVQ